MKGIIQIVAALFLCTLAQASSRIVVLPTTPAVDQNRTLQCWAVAANSRLEAAARRATGQEVRLSARYLFFAKTLLEVSAQIARGDASIYEQGGSFVDAVEAAKLAGVVPEESFPGFPDEDARLYAELNALIKELAPQAAAQGPEAIEARVRAVLERHLGKPPKRAAAKEYFKQVLPGWERAGAVELNYVPGGSRRAISVEAFNGVRYTAYETGDHGELLETIGRQLLEGEPFLIQYRAVHEGESMDHYVLAIGARYNDRGRCEALLVKNSWGQGPGGSHVHWLESDYLFLVNATELTSVKR